jgi:hypothetical protein
MQFLYPSFLWALLALAIPIIVHLFYFRRFKKVYFTNVRFLKEIKEETSSRNKLKNLLVLLMRCLALAALVFAFAQPFIAKNNTLRAGSKALSIFIDNSFSMNAEKENVPLIEIAKERARSIVEACSPDDKIQILTNDFEGRHQRMVSKENALTLINEVVISPAVQNMSNVINRQRQVLKEEVNISYLLSDFQKSISNLEHYKDTSMEINLLPIQASIDKNVSIDSVWFEGPVPVLNQNNKLLIRITNHSNQLAEEVKSSFFKDGQEKPIAIKNIGAHGSRIDTIAVSILKPGIHEAELRLVDYPVQFDDKYYISFYIPEKAKVLSINQGTSNKYLNALFDGIKYFQLDNQDIGQVQFQKFSEYNLILLNDLRSISSGLSNELNQYIKSGGNVLVFPAADLDKNAYNTFLTLCGALTLGDQEKKVKNVGNINTEEYVFSDVYEKNIQNLKLPSTKLSYAIGAVQKAGKESLLKYRDGTDYMSKYVNEEGHMYVCASPLNSDYSDLVTNAEVFVPMLYKMALSKVKREKLAYIIGRDNTIEVDRTVSAEAVYKIKGNTEFIPGQNNVGKKIRLDVKGQIKEAGYYGLHLDNKELNRLAFNYNRQESNLDVSTISEIEAFTKNKKINIITEGEQKGLKQYVGERDKGIVLWKWFIVAALLFLLLEMVIIRFVK